MYKFKTEISRVFLVCIALILIFSMSPSTVFAKDYTRTIKVGYTTNYGISYTSGHMSGYAYAYLQEIAKYTGWEYEFICLDWDDGLDKLEKGEIDLFGPMQKTPEREQMFAYPEIQLGYEYGTLYVGSNNSSYYFDDFEAFDGMRVGTNSKNFFNSRLEEYCKANNFSVQLVYTDVSNFAKGLEAGEFDAFLAGSLTDFDNTVAVSKISSDPFYYVTQKENTDIVDGLNFALKSIYAKDVYFPAKLEMEYYSSKTINRPAFTKEEGNFIEHCPALRVVCDPRWSPIEYYDNDEEKFKGINIDILENVSRESGLKFEYIMVEDYEESKRMIMAGEADILMGYSYIAPLENNVTYTQPFMEMPVVLAGFKNIDTSKRLTIGIRERESPLAVEIMSKFPNYEYRTFNDTDGVRNAVKLKEVDASFVSSYVFDEMIRRDSLHNYVTIPTDISFPQCIGVSNNIDETCISVLNKSIKRISDEQVTATIFANTVNRAYTLPIIRIFRDNSFLISVVLLLFIMAILFLNNNNRIKLERIAYTDSLTGLNTVAKFKILASQIIKESAPGELRLASIDIDDFKYINDSFGYNVGNDILAAIANHFLEHLAPGAIICHVAADNFLLLGKSLPPDEEKRRCETLLSVRNHTLGILPEHYSMCMSVGTYRIQNMEENLSLIIDKANIARKSIKGDNAHLYAEYTAKMDEQAEWKKEVTLSMEAALINDQFEVYLQPKYLLNNEVLIGAEALARWNHPTLGLLQPAKFIPIFEQSGFITKLDIFVFEKTCALLKKWRDENMVGNFITISVNLSRLHLNNNNLVDELLDIAEKYDVNPKYIEIELTESIVFHNTTVLIETMTRLRKEGFQISIDDFGSGYSSLNILKDLPIDILKIDKGFLGDSSEISNGRVIINSVTSMAKSLHLTTVAEGVETKEQAKMLLNMGCDIAQGYYYAKPMPISNFEELL